jgi:hypothetical protein
MVPRVVMTANEHDGPGRKSHVVEKRHVHGGEAEHRTHRDVEPPDEDDEGHPHGHDGDDRNVADDRLEIGVGEEVGRRGAEERHQDDQEHPQRGNHALAVDEDLGEFLLEGLPAFPLRR